MSATAGTAAYHNMDVIGHDHPSESFVGGILFFSFPAALRPQSRLFEADSTTTDLAHPEKNRTDTS
jgi:hypothetical protein